MKRRWDKGKEPMISGEGEDSKDSSRKRKWDKGKEPMISECSGETKVCKKGHTLAFSPRLKRQRAEEVDDSKSVSADLPIDLLPFILKSSSAEDLVWFSATSKTWNTIVTSMPLPKLSPCLLLAEGANHKRGICSVFGGRPIRFYLSHFYESRIWGSTDGWVLVLGIVNLQLTLLNPLTKSYLMLPSMFLFPMYHNSTHFAYSYICKIALSDCTKGKPRYIVAIHHGSRYLAYCCPGDDRWSHIDTFFRGGFEDVVYLAKAERFFAIRSDGMLFGFEPGTKPSRVSEIAPPPRGISSKNGKFYLVDISSALHLILRKLGSVLRRDTHPRHFRYETLGFEMYRLDSDLRCWTEVHELSHAIFLGSNSSFAVPIANYNISLKGSIFYNDDHEEVLGRTEFSDIGMYDYKSKMIKMLNLPLRHVDIHSCFSPATFFLPSLSLSCVGNSKRCGW